MGLPQLAAEERHDGLRERDLDVRIRAPRPASRPLVTIRSAMSPTTFDDGVTLTMSPNIPFTCEYARATSCQRVSSMPSDRACSRRLVYCPPGIPCTYTSEAPARISDSNAA